LTSLQNGAMLSQKGRSGGLEGGFESSVGCSLDGFDSGEFKTDLAVDSGGLSHGILAQDD